jgi:hypothetical protein
MTPWISWRARALMVYAAVRTAVTGQHVYLSTGCLLGEHEYCKAATGRVGSKPPGMAKFSNALCICPTCKHHDRAGDQ